MTGAEKGKGVRRRDFLTGAGLGLTGLGLTGLTGCIRTEAAGAIAPIRAATYLSDSYDDLYPGAQVFLDTASGHSGPRLSFDLFDSGTLLGAEQLLPGLLLEVTDLMFQTSSYVSSTFPVLGAMELPFITEDFARHRRAIDPGGPLFALVNERLAAQNVRVLGGMPTSFEYLWTVSRPIRRPEDVRGMRIRVAGEIEGETVKALGGAPVSMGSAEVYQALERGTIDGLMSYVGTVVSRDLHQIVRYGTVGHFGAYTVDSYCRADWFHDRPPESQQALQSGGRALYREGTDIMAGVHTTEYLPSVERAGVELIEPGRQQLAAFRRAVAPVYHRWRALLGDPGTADRAVDFVRNA